MMFNINKWNKRKRYNSFRGNQNSFLFCKAPYTSLRFHRNGAVHFCCHHIDYHFLLNKSLKEIWFGKEFEKMRAQMKSYNIPKSCNFCANPFYSENYSSVNALSFDYLDINDNGYPVLMDFSLDNTCNLACIMCDASLSSKIQEKKKHKPKSKKKCYDDEFVKQLEEFIPYLKYAVFTGGEPFLINIYYKIWEKMVQINPEIIINITTNGTLINERINHFLKNAKVNITVSIDSFIPETYQKIRVGADFNKLMLNVNKFADICSKRNTEFTVTVCPMIINAFEIPEIVKTCNDNAWNFNYNTVLKPWSQALWSLESEDILSIISFYESFKFNIIDKTSHNNIEKFRTLINLLINWNINIKHLYDNQLSVTKREVIKKEIFLLLTKTLQHTDTDYTSIVKEVIAGIPEILLREELLTYLKRNTTRMLINEFEENDQDTIIDHMCIVAFNL